MKQRLGQKKHQRLEALTGRKVKAAFTRGGFPHGWAEVFFEGEVYTLDAPPPMVNYSTGEIQTGGNPLLPVMRAVAAASGMADGIIEPEAKKDA